MKPETYVRNGSVVTESSTFLGGVVIDGGRITQLIAGNPEIEAESIVDATGLWILPGAVDGHVHFNEPGRTDWEGYRTGSMAAAAGGVTTVIEMPLNAAPPSTDREKLLAKRRAAEGQSVVDYANWGGLVDNNLDDLESMWWEGVVGFKAFLSDSGVDFARINDDVLYAGLRRSRELGFPIALHAENEWVTAHLEGLSREAGRVDRKAWSDSRPPATELEAIRRALFWALETGGRLHIVHVGLADGVRAIADARLQGARVTVETCPHYLFFTDEDFVRIGPEAKCAPPIRSASNREDLWQCVEQGLVDTIGSDHSPCFESDKKRGDNDIWQAWAGITGIQTMLPAILTEGVHRRAIPPSAFVRMFAANPARIFGLHTWKGSMSPGSDADLILVDPQREWTMRREDLKSKNQHSAYVGSTFLGGIERTIVRGRTVFQDGVITAPPGYGRLVRRQHIDKASGP